MENFYLAFRVVSPLSMLIALGYFLKYIKFFEDDFLKTANSLCFKVFMPTLVFINVYSSDFSKVFQIDLVIYGGASVLVAFGFLMLFIPKVEKYPEKVGVVIQGAFRSNFVLFGIPIASALAGDNAAGTASVMIAFLIPILNVTSVIALEVFRGRVDFGRILRGIVSNPLIISSLVAIAFVVMKIKIPYVLEVTVRDVGKIATPLALILLGGSFKFSRLNGNEIKLFFVSAFKLVVMPAIFLSGGVILGYRGVELICLMALFGSPTAVSSFTMAENMGADGELAAQIVVITTVFSIITMFILIVILKNMLLI